MGKMTKSAEILESPLSLIYPLSESQDVNTVLIILQFETIQL